MKKGIRILVGHPVKQNLSKHIVCIEVSLMQFVFVKYQVIKELDSFYGCSENSAEKYIYENDMIIRVQSILHNPSNRMGSHVYENSIIQVIQK